mmetsp:Transcript_31614/g.31081  ORF Transcript_31614/g.31081 Transcript_31614/m.31081 type:complete len:141 (-) Transcript_31614:19-441(-)|eukprot:CAMPEP_0197007754 /NCGR_PEP_ID=MMETSP1380-20130617/42169_1 /TAXON_ID=5936 /ORGANISM="Euplotes crassus, Strain CT5" /LENGTH=140 /DNA_ID=CAMNT_0042428011 /DNA_START=370 /DNA_END=792 /DNA_ORIENTATION=-
MKKVVISLTENLKHQHSKVRRSSLNALKVVIGCKGAEEFLEEALPQLKMTINDRHHDVRRVCVRVIDYWLKNMDINATKKFQKDLLLFLLNGVSDEMEEISEQAVSILERHGTDMKEALVALGEEEAEEEKKDVEMELEG